MYDDWNNAGHGSPDHVGDVWHDDHADGTDGRRRRLLCGNSAVRGKWSKKMMQSCNLGGLALHRMIFCGDHLYYNRKMRKKQWKK